MTFSDIVDAITAATDLPRGRVYMHGRRLQEVGLIPIGEGGRHAPECDSGHVVLILLSLLSGKPLHHASTAAARYATLTSQGSTLLIYLSAMLDSVASVDIDALREITDLPEELQLAFKSHVTVVAGEQPVVIVRYSCIDQPLEVAFTENCAAYEPEAVETITESRSIPGIFVFRLGRALRELSQ